jgi:2-dehydro-3-deoxygalactonokinase
MTAATALIGLDWGTTSFRAYRIGAGGAVLERRETVDGILQAIGGDFQAVLSIQIGDWLASDPATPILASGMIGSRQGWLEVPYAQCPAGPREIAAGIEHLESRGRRIHFVPGLMTRGADGVPDVMRGEETQIFGIVGDGAGAERLVLPGSHSKWVEVRAGAIAHFSTYMTGEVFSAVQAHTILGRTMVPGDHDRDAFERGAGYGLREDASSGGLLKRLFSARTLALFDELKPGEGADYLSGLMIGCEIREALAVFPAAGVVRVVGRSALAELYAAALTLAGIDPLPAPEDAAALGLHRLAEAAGIV